MSPIEILTLPGSVPPPPQMGERADAAGFLGLVNEHSSRPPRGRLAAGTALERQAEAETARLDEGSGLVPAGPLILPGVENPGPPPTPESDGAQINPGLIDGSVKAETPQVNPGRTGEAKTDGAQVNPGPADGSVKPQGPQVLPTESEPGDAAPRIMQAQVMQALGDVAQATAVQATVRQAVQAVSRPAETSRPVVAPEASARAADGEVLAELSAGADAPAPIAASADGGTAAQGGASQTSNGQTSAGQTSAGQAAAGQAQPTDIAARSDAEAMVETVDPMDAAPAEGEAPAAPRSAEPTVAAQTIRADAPVVQRQGFDAVAQVAAQIIRRLEGRSTRFEMELHPADMGRVDVRLDIDAEGRVAARLAFDNPAAAADLRGRADELRRNLEEAGFQVSDDSFSFADREGAREGRPDSSDADRRSLAQAALAAERADAEAQPAWRVLTRMGVDVRI